MTDQPSRPALADADLRETLDLLSTVVASMSDRIDGQSQTLDRLTKTAAETRQAAFAARGQTDPDYFAKQIGIDVAENMKPILKMHLDLVRMLTDEMRNLTAFKGAYETERADLLKNIRQEAAEAKRWRKRIPFIAVSGFILVLGLGFSMPRFLDNSSTYCRITGGEIMFGQNSQAACVRAR